MHQTVECLTSLQRQQFVSNLYGDATVQKLLGRYFAHASINL